MFFVLDCCDPCVAKWFPYFPDLIGARAWLDWSVLSVVVPWWPYAIVHVWEDLGAGDVEEFRYRGHVKVHSTIIEDF